MTELQDPTNTPQVADFELSDTLKRFQEETREFSQTELAPNAAQWDRE